MNLTRRGLLGAAGSMAFGLTIDGAGAVTPLAGRSIRFLIGNEGSGGYEAYARLFSTHLALTLPQSNVTVEVVPTADGRLAAKRIFEADRGELVIGLFESALIYASMSGESGVAFDLAKFNWLGKLAVDERVILASRQSGITTIADLAQHSGPAIYPASTIASRGSFECYIVNTLVGLPIRPVAGYNGAERDLAMLSGEAQVVLGSYASSADLVENGDAVVLLRLNEVPRPSVPTSIPLLREVLRTPGSPLVDLIELSSNLGRWIAAPPTASPEDVAALRAAFDTTVASAAFVADAAQQRLPLDPLPGIEVQEKVVRLFAREARLKDDLLTTVACGKRRADGDLTC